MSNLKDVQDKHKNGIVMAEYLQSWIDRAYKAEAEIKDLFVKLEEQGKELARTKLAYQKLKAQLEAETDG